MSWRALFRLAALAALIPSWIGLLGAWHWGLDLLAHFRWQYLACSLAIIGWAVWQRHRNTLLLAVLTCLLNVFLIARLAWPAEVAGLAVADDFTLRVLSFNVRTANPDKQAVLDHVQRADADLVLLIEVDSSWLMAMEPLAAEYPHRIAHPRGDNFGIALFSRTALNDAELLALPEAGFPSIVARISHQGRNIVFIGTHPPPPVGARFAGLQEGKFRLLAETVAATEDPVLLVGDLNATPWSHGMRILTAGKLAFRSLEPPWVPTWSASSPFAIPIDHVLATSPLVITRRAVGPDVGSDHRSIDFTVGWVQ